MRIYYIRRKLRTYFGQLLWRFSGRCFANDMLQRPLCKLTNLEFACTLREKPRKAVRMASVPTEVRNWSDSIVASLYAGLRQCYIRSFIFVRTLRDIAHFLQLFLLCEYIFSDCWVCMTFETMDHTCEAWIMSDANLWHSISKFRKRNSSVCKAVWVWDGHSRSCDLMPSRVKGFRLIQSIQTCAGVHPISCSVGKGALFRRGLKWTYLEADHTHAWSAEIRNEWNCNSIPLFVFLASTGTSLKFTYLRIEYAVR